MKLTVAQLELLGERILVQYSGGRLTQSSGIYAPRDGVTHFIGEIAALGDQVNRQKLEGAPDLAVGDRVLVYRHSIKPVEQVCAPELAPGQDPPNFALVTRSEIVARIRAHEGEH